MWKKKSLPTGSLPKYDVSGVHVENDALGSMYAEKGHGAQLSLSMAISAGVTMRVFAEAVMATQVHQ